MLRRVYIFGIAILLAFAAVVMAERVSSPIQSLTPLRLYTGDEDLSNVPMPANPHPSRLPLDDPLGELYQAGTTWYDYQHNGTPGKMISVDADGYIHVVWMNGLNSAFNPRHVYYNVWDPSSETFSVPNGSQINATIRAGYACNATYDNGFCFPAFHEIITGANAHTASAIDFLPRSGAFTTSQPSWCYISGVEQQYIWPKIAFTPDGRLHLVSTLTTPNAGDPQVMLYSRGTPQFDPDGFGLDITWDAVGGDCDFQFVDSVMTIAGDIAASRHSNRVVIAWAHPRSDLTDANTRNQIDNDLYIQISEDGGQNWGPRTNITNFVPGDLNCPSQDTLVCDNDTLRLYTDCSVIIDNEDYIHVAFTVRTWYDVGYPGYGPGPLGWIDKSGIYHWSEEYDEFSPVANAYYFQTIEGGTLIQNGAWQLNKHRPSLAEDTTNGMLYCSYQMYDSTQYSDAGYPMGDAWVAKSCNGGRVWTEAVNVTRTDGGQNTPPPGSMSERDITLAKYVTTGNDGNKYLHMEYVFDHDAGAVIQTPPEGTATLNEVYYQRIPADSIPDRPLLSPYWPAIHVDSSGFPGYVIPLDTTVQAMCADKASDRPTLRPESFNLYQNYPNPFNPTTKIAFDLTRDARVTLKVYNVMGQEVATPMDNKMLGMGAQNVVFDASKLSSGVYIYRVTVDGVMASKKMVLMK